MPMPTVSTPANQLKGAIVNSLNHRPMTLAELQSATATSLPTVRRSLQELIDSGWVRPFGQSASTGGRPATLFGLDTTSRLIIGAHVEIPTVNMVAAEPGGNKVNTRHVSAQGALLPDDAVRAIVDYVADIRAEFPDREIIGIGIAGVGYVDPVSGDILYVGRAEGWRNYPLKSRLEEALRLPVVMESDTDCMIRVEIDSTDLPVDRDAVYLAVLEGVKMSMLLNGHLYRGPFSNSGLIGRTSVRRSLGETVAAEVEDATIRHIGLYDLEDVASVGGVCAQFDRLAEKWEGEHGAGADPTIVEISAIANRNHKYDAVLLAAADGHALCRAVAEEMIASLMDATVNMLFILQPMTLIFGGRLSKLPDSYRAQLERGVRDRLPTLLSNQLTIRYATITGRYAAAHGATYWFMRRHIADGLVFEAENGKAMLVGARL